MICRVALVPWLIHTFILYVFVSDDKEEQLFAFRNIHNDNNCFYSMNSWHIDIHTIIIINVKIHEM